MGIENLIDPKPAPTRIGAMFAIAREDLVLDALVREDEQQPNKVTDFPVEDGAAISDNVVPQADLLTVQGVISNSPLYDIVDVLSGVSFGKDKDGNQILGSGINRAELAWRKLSALRSGGQLIHVITPRQTFTNLAILNLQRVKETNTGDVLEFTMACKRIRRATTRFITTVKDTRTGATQPHVDKGEQTAGEVPAPAKEKATIAWKIEHGLGLGPK